MAWMFRNTLTHLPPRYLLQYEGGIGDSLLCTAVFRELRRRGARGLWMATRHPELFRYNRDVDHVLEPASRVDSYVRLMGGKLVDPQYARYDSHSDRHVYQEGHQIAVMCASAGITGQVALRPYVHLAEAERAAGRLAPGQIVIHSSGAAARYAIPNKEWFPERFARVSTELSRRALVLQIGSAQDPLLPGVRDLRGKTSLRETAAILSQARVFVGLEGFLMHLARAVECRSVIVYGGHSNPAQLGYSANCNLFTALPCAPCGQRSACAHDRECMRAISPELVLAGVERQLERGGTPLPEDHVVLPEAA
jgi:ADP-heptose:LPS heptosyltransferase